MATLEKLASSITPNGMNQGPLVSYLRNVRDVVEAHRQALMNSAMGAAGLAIGTGATTSYRHTIQTHFRAAGILKQTAAAADHAFTAADVVTQNLWGAWLITLTGTTWKSTRVSASPMAYASEALALAAIASMAVPADEAVMGIITVRARSTVDFTANTTNLTADNGVGNAQTVNYYDGGFKNLSLMGDTSGKLVLTKG